MRTRIRRLAHLLERAGLAMAGATCGLLVAVHVGSSIAVLTTQGFIVIMMMAGAVAFYLGIDTPPLPFHEPGSAQAQDGTGEKADSAEFLSAVGTFLATLAAFVSMVVIAFRDELPIAGTWLVMFGWVTGIAMQAVAGAIARLRR